MAPPVLIHPFQPGSRTITGGDLNDMIYAINKEFASITGGFPVAHAPEALVSLTPKEGINSTFMRSDGAPALDQTIAPTWTGAHTFSNTFTIKADGATASFYPAAGTTGFGWRILSTAVGAADGSLRIDHTNNGFSSNVTNALTLDPSGNMSVTGNVNVQGNISSTSNTQPASPTNSGVALNATPNIADVQMFDATRSANNRTAEWIFFNGAAALRFANDAHDAVLVPFSVTGGQTGITGITSNSGTGAWAHTAGGTVRFTISATDLAAGTGYTPVNALSLATKAYVDAKAPPPANYSTVTATAGTTLAASTLSGAAHAFVARSGPTAAFTDTTDTAANLISAFPGAQVGFSWQASYINGSTGLATLAGGTGVTISGNNQAAPTSANNYVFKITGAATVTAFYVGASPM